MNHSRRLAVLLAGALALGISGCAQAQPLPTPTPPTPPTSATIGDPLDGGEWIVTVNAADLDATEEVAAANEFNPAPGEALGYATVNVTVERTGSGAAMPLDIDLSLIADDETVGAAPAAAPTQLHLLVELEPGDEATGNIAFLVPIGTDSAQVRVTPGAGAQTYLVDVP